jgi:GNAT superfamily N-acetyltransferase
LPTSSSLSEFATCPAAFVPPTADLESEVETQRYLLRISPRDAVLTRLRFEPDDAADVLAEVRRATPKRLALSTERAELAEAFRELGFHDPKPPAGAWCTALALDREPPAVAGVEVRRVESADELELALEIERVAFERDEHADAASVWVRRRSRPGADWLAYLDGEPVGYGGAVACDHGLYLAGGATVPNARGRGAYRALVRARWDYAVERGTPALVVHAQETSRPILERLGFDRVCTIYELELDG